MDLMNSITYFNGPLQQTNNRQQKTSLLPWFLLFIITMSSRCSTFDIDVDNIRCVESQTDPLDEDAIFYNYTVFRDDVTIWKLLYTFSWTNPPVGNSILYLVDAMFETRDTPLSPWDFKTCREAVDTANNASGEGLIATDTYTFEAPFTHTGLFRIIYGIADGGVFVPIPIGPASNVEFETPDCYSATGDAEFCASQEVSTCGQPIDTQLTEVRLVDNMTILNFQWRSPVQVNKLAVLHEYELQLHTANGSLLTVDKVPAERDEMTWSTNRGIMSGRIEQGESYVLTVTPYVFYMEETTPPVQGRLARYKFVAIITPVLTTDMLAFDEVETTTIDYRKFTDSEEFTEPISTPSPDNTAIVIVLSFLVVGAVLTLLVAILLLRRRQGKDGIEQSYFRGLSEMERKPAPMLESKEIHHDQLTLDEKLGEGEFGVVYKGLVTGLKSNPDGISVAVKTTKDGASNDLKEGLIDEMKLIAELGDHENILSLIACCSTSEPYYLITVFMKYGDLLGFLRRSRKQGARDKDPVYHIGECQQLAIACDIAQGMAHIQTLRYYHGDLAARNVLVGDGLNIKISDFGLADDIYTRGYKRRAAEQKIPIKWCSIETVINGICTTEGDVWSFGIVLYEVFTLGGTPYPGISPRYLITQLKQGHRMEQPKSCPDDVYTLMKCCWQEDPNSRPRFADLAEKLCAMKLKATFASGRKAAEVSYTGCNTSGDEGKESVNIYDRRLATDLAPINDKFNNIDIDELQAALTDETGKEKYMTVLDENGMPEMDGKYISVLDEQGIPELDAKYMPVLDEQDMPESDGMRYL